MRTDWGWPSEGGSGGPIAPRPFGVAVDSHDDVYFVVLGRVGEVGATGVPLGAVTRTRKPVSNPYLSRLLPGVDPATDDLLVLDQTERCERFRLQRYVSGCPVPFWTRVRRRRRLRTRI